MQLQRLLLALCASSIALREDASGSIALRENASESLRTNLNFTTMFAREALRTQLYEELVWQSPCKGSEELDSQDTSTKKNKRCPETGCGCNKGCRCANLLHSCKTNGLLREWDDVTQEEGICRTANWVYALCAVLVLALPTYALFARCCGWDN